MKKFSEKRLFRWVLKFVHLSQGFFLGSETIGTGAVVNKPEQQFWNLLKDHLPGDFSRIENYAESGMPDVNGGWIGNPYWIELKVCKNKEKIAHPKVLCEDYQIAWHARRCRHDNNIFVITKYHDKIVAHKILPSREYRLVFMVTKDKNKWPWAVFTEWFENEIQIIKE